MPIPVPSPEDESESIELPQGFQPLDLSVRPARDPVITGLPNVVA
jgi:hypothetical protein